MKISLSTKVALGTFFVAGIGVLMVAFLSYAQISSYFKENILNTLAFELKDNIEIMKKNITDIKKDAKLLKFNKNIAPIKRSLENNYHYDAKSNKTLKGLKEELGDTFKSVLEHSEAYFNIRLIARDGEELVVALRDGEGTVFVQKKKLLQNKAKRPYFQDAISLKDGDFYVSKINLNREYGKIVYPHIPTIRVATPIYIDKELFGIIIINANINKLFTPLVNNTLSEQRIYLANEDGYYLFHENIEKTFGFDLGIEDKLATDFNLQIKKYFDGHIAFVFDTFELNSRERLYVALTTTDKFLKEQSFQYKQKLGIYVLGVSLFIAVMTLLLVQYLIVPIRRLTKSARSIADGKDNDTDLLNIDSNDELGELSFSLQKMFDTLQESKRSVEKQVEERTRELNELNENLEKMVTKKTDENIRQLKAMEEQAKMASMGEMIGAIAHQWRQPLNEISVSIQNLRYDYEDGLVDEAFIEKFIAKNKKVIEFMSHTIDDFRNFYRVDKTKKPFDVKEAVEATISLQLAQLKNNDIDILVEGKSFIVNGLKNEFQQVVLNIINNAKDALLENGVADAKIWIILKDNSVRIEDNAGGVPLEVIDRLFEPYFTTKEQGKGTGMGLYMSKMIIEENMKGRISVHNSDAGAIFRIEFYEKK